MAIGHLAECQLAIGHLADRHFTDRILTDIHFAERQLAIGHLVECQLAIGHLTERQLAIDIWLPLKVGSICRGIRRGFCWKGLFGDGFICGFVDPVDGSFSGDDLAFVYPDFKTAIRCQHLFFLLAGI